MDQAVTGLNKFKNLLEEINSIAAWVMPTVGISPVVASLVGLNPPWPHKIGLTVATSAVVLFALVVVFQFLAHRMRHLVNAVMLASLLAALALGIAYFSAQAFLVYQTPVTGEVFAKGFQCTDEAVQLFGKKCPWLDLDELKTAEYEATRLWTLPSIAISKLTLLFLWFGLFAMCSVALGAFVRYQSSIKEKP